MNNTPAFAAETLADLVRGAADRWADRPALIFDDPKTTLSFADIEAGTNAIANVLADIGVAYGNRVAVMLRNRPEFPLIWLALAKLGAVMVPVNVYYQETDAAFVLSHSGATMIITEGDFVPLATKMRGKVATVQLVVSIENVEESATIKSLAARLPGAPKSVLLQRQIYPETIANIQYTSGTTGKPKGCMLSHKYWCRLGRIVADGPPELSETDVLLTAQPFYYMDPQWNLTGAFQVGATLVVLDRFHPSTFWSKVREYHVSFFYCLGMMPAAMYAMPPSGLDREHEVRAISCSAIPTRLHAALEQRWGVPWYEAFGMTETGGDLRIQPRDHDDTIGKACIGRPYYDREVRVVDSDNQQVPRGTQGEMVLRGVGMMEGYFEDEEATNRAFVGGWFHTGDLVREDEQGRIFYLGRTKDTIRRLRGGLCSRSRRPSGRGGKGVCRAARGRSRRVGASRGAQQMVLGSPRLLQGATLLDVRGRPTSYPLRAGCQVRPGRRGHGPACRCLRLGRGHMAVMRWETRKGAPIRHRERDAAIHD